MQPNAWYYHDGARWYAVADPRQAPPLVRVWSADEVTVETDAAGNVVSVRAGRP